MIVPHTSQQGEGIGKGVFGIHGKALDVTSALLPPRSTDKDQISTDQTLTVISLYL